MTVRSLVHARDIPLLSLKLTGPKALILRSSPLHHLPRASIGVVGLAIMSSTTQDKFTSTLRKTGKGHPLLADKERSCHVSVLRRHALRAMVHTAELSSNIRLRDSPPQLRRQVLSHLLQTSYPFRTYFPRKDCVSLTPSPSHLWFAQSPLPI
jgi:hypothetical protein